MKRKYLLKTRLHYKQNKLKLLAGACLIKFIRYIYIYLLLKIPKYVYVV